MRAPRADRLLGSQAAAASGLPLLRVVVAIVLGLATSALTVASSIASAHAMPVRYSAGSTGVGRAGNQSVAQSAAPTAVIGGREATVTWPATSLSGGTPAGGYTVRRYTVGGSLQTTLAACSGTVTATSCVEHNVPTGTWRYSVQAVTGGWVGPESPLGASVTVGDASLSLTPTTLNVLPATLTGTITSFSGGAGLSFRLDSPTGTVLAGSPSTVPANGSASVTVTVPAGTSDSPHSIFAVGSTGNSASAAISIVDPPDLVTLAMRDSNSNGKVDQVLATFNETLASYTAGIAPWTLSNTPSGGSLTDVTVSGAVATLAIAEGPGAATTAIGTFKVALAENSAGVRDANGHVASFGATTPVDQAPPAVLTAVMQDTGTVPNGKVDRVVVTFSETMAAYSAGTAPWSLASTPSGGSLASVAASGTTATLTITEGAGAADTSVGSFLVTMSSNAAGVRDAIGNLASFSRTPTDGAKPVRTLSEMYDLDADARVDRAVVTFSEPLAPYTAPNGIWTMAAAPSGATLSTVTVSGSQATLALDEGAGAPTTAVGSFTTALAADAAGIRDTAGNLASYTAVAPTDRAKPVLLTLTMEDSTANGKVDRVTALFSEALTGYTAGTAPWTLTNVPSGGTIASVTTSSATATVVITEGAGAVDTAVGSMTVALATNANGVHDAALNLSSFAPVSPLDGAKPVSVTVTDTNGTTDGRIQPGDTLVITFSEPLNPSSVPANTTVSLTDPSGTGNDTLAITGILNGERTTTSNLHITLDASSAGFAGSAVALSNGNRTVTITVGSTCAGTGCGSIGTATGATNLSFLAAATLLDVAGNVPTTTAKSYSLRLF